MKFSTLGFLYRALSFHPKIKKKKKKTELTRRCGFLTKLENSLKFCEKEINTKKLYEVCTDAKQSKKTRMIKKKEYYFKLTIYSNI